MRILMYPLLLVLFVLSCAKDNPIVENPDITAPNEVATSTISSYDASKIPPQKPLEENLLTNGSFEEEGWLLCGSASIKSSPDAREGNRYLELNTNAQCSYEEDTSYITHGSAYYALNIDEMPEEIFISFYAKSSSAMELLDNKWGVLLLSDFKENGDFGSAVKFFNIYDDRVAPSWTLIKLSLTKAEIQEYLGNATPKWLYFVMSSRFAAESDVFLAIDDVRVTYKKEHTQPDPMPDNLLNYTGDDQLLLYNADKQIVASMKPNGSNFVNYENLSTELVSSMSWFSNNEILIGRKVFNPMPNNDPQIIANSQTELYQHNLATGKETLLFKTLGKPGKYEYDGSPNNLYALDLEVKRIAWDANRKMGALTSCGRNRDNVYYVSDDYCEILIIDENGKEISSVKGFNAAWSPSGKLAFVDENSLHIANISGSTITTEVVYESTLGLAGVVEWSADGNSLAFMENGGDVVAEDYAKAIKILNLSTKKTKALLFIDHGKAYPNISWSKDGNYMVYSIYIPNETNPNIGYNQVWWLEVATGKTGPITNTVNAFGATFRK